MIRWVGSMGGGGLFLNGCCGGGWNHVVSLEDGLQCLGSSNYLVLCRPEIWLLFRNRLKHRRPLLFRKTPCRYPASKASQLYYSRARILNRSRAFGIAIPRGQVLIGVDLQRGGGEKKRKEVSFFGVRSVTRWSSLWSQCLLIIGD